jgi:hypothetical protein
MVNHRSATSDPVAKSARDGNTCGLNELKATAARIEKLVDPLRAGRVSEPCRIERAAPVNDGRSSPQDYGFDHGGSATRASVGADTVT